MGSPEAARRARRADRRRPLTGGTTPTGPGYLAFLTNNGFPTTVQNSVIDITDEGIDKGVVPAPAGSHPDFFRQRRPDASRAGSCTRTRPAPPTPTPATAAATAPTSPRSPPGYNNADRRDGRGRAGLQLRARHLAARRSSARRRSSTAPATSTSPTSITALHNAAYATRRPDLEQLLGRGRRRRVQHPVAGVRRARARRPAGRRRQPAVHRGRLRRQLRRGRKHDRLPGDGQERDHGRRLGERAARSAPPTAAASPTRVPTAPRTSSTSPAADRPTTAGMKPDVVAPGTHVSGAQPQTGADFNGSGTCNPQFPAGSSARTRSSPAPRRRPPRSPASRRCCATGSRARNRRRRAPSAGDDQGDPGQHRDRRGRRQRRRRRHQREPPDPGPGLGPDQPEERPRRHRARVRRPGLEVDAAPATATGGPTQSPTRPSRSR